jgi:RNA polymerase sigma factor (sigma-70 family)
VPGVRPPRRDALMTPADDREPIGAADDEEARRRVETLYRAQAGRLTRRLRARLGSREEARDVLHEAFARLLGSGAVQQLREPEAFLNRILRNLLIDRARRPAPIAQPFEEDLVAVRADQADALELEQMKKRYREIVARLPARMREVFLLHRVDGLCYKAIAERLGISIRTVEWHMAEAIVRIGRELDADEQA